MLDESLVRAINCEGVEVDLSLLFTCAYIEFMNLEGAQLILEFSDVQALIRDQYGFVAGATLEVEFDDYSNDSVIETFEVLTQAPARDGKIIINAMQSWVAASKKPANKPMFFVDESIGNIVKALMPEVAKWDAESISGKFTYHLVQNMAPSDLIQKICRDLGISVFVLRGVGYIKKCEGIEGESSVVTLEYNNPAAEYAIASLNPFDLSKVWAREIGKAYFSWSMVGGMIGGESLDGSPVFVPNRTAPALKNLSKQFMPVLDLNCFGSLQMAPSKNIEMIFHRHDEENVIDESLPDIGTITRITHFQQGVTYSCNIEVSVYEHFK